MADRFRAWLNGLLAVRSLDPARQRRGRLFGILVLGAITVGLLTTIINLVQLASRLSSEATLFVVADVLATLLIIGLLRLNQLGHVRSASVLFLVAFVAIVSFVMKSSSLDRVLILYVIPTMAASFLIGPGSSFIFAALSVLGYTITYMNAPSQSYNYFSAMGLFLAALIAWLAATNLENALREIRKHAEELDRRVADRTHDLADALSKNQAILEGIADGVIVFDTAGQATVANPAINSLLERPSSEIIHCDIQTLIEGNVNAAEQQIVMSLLASRDTRYPAKLQWGRKTLSVSFAPVRAPTGDVTGTVAVFRDVTQEAQVDRMKSAILSMASHDLRTPISAIMGYVEMLQESVYGPLSDTQHSTMDRIMSNIKRLSSLVNDLLDQAQMEAGRLTLKITPFAPSDLIDGAQSVMAVLAQNKGLEFTTHIADDVPATLHGDPQRLHQILVNLTGNSLKFTEHGRVHVSVYCPDSTHWALQVSDTGPGIPADKLDKVFDRFYQVDDVAIRRYSGIGLGLAIVKELVTLMAGEVQVESEVGRGSTFRVLLPLVPRPLQEAPS